MNKFESCVCGCKSVNDGLCEKCRFLLRAKRSKNIKIIEKFRSDYNQSNTYKSYGQFVLMLDMIDRRKREIDDRRKKAVVKKVRGNRR